MIALPRKNMNLPYSIRMYWKNFWQPTAHVKQNIFEKNLIEVGSSYLYASFGTFCVQIGQFLEAVSLRKMFENGKIAVFEGKCRRFQILSKSLKIHSTSNNWPIWTQKVPIETWRCELQTSMKVCSKNILLYMNGGLSKIRSLHTVLAR